MTYSFHVYTLQTRMTAVYPEVGTGSALALAYVGLGLGEAGEVQGKIKKVIRDAGGELTDEHRNAIEAELGDLMWYVARLCDEAGLSFDNVLAKNVSKLLDRKDRGCLGGSGDYR